MTMANGTQTQDKRLQFKPRKSSKENIPDAPEGGWKFLIPKGKCKVTVTANGDPRLLITHKLVEALDEKNESHQGSEVTQSVIIFDDEDNEKRRGANMMKDRLRAMCEALEVDFGDVYPEEINSADDFIPLFKAIEGQSGTCWTVHTSRQNASNETVTDTEIRYKEPGKGLVTKGADSDDDDRPGKKGSGGKTTKKR
jgi:hypothetical protein